MCAKAWESSIHEEQAVPASQVPLYQNWEFHLANFLEPSALREAGQSNVQGLHLEENFYFC